MGNRLQRDSNASKRVRCGNLEGACLLSNAFVVATSSFRAPLRLLNFAIARSVLGEGFFGTVYKAEWREIVVAVKRLKNVSSEPLPGFQRWIALQVRKGEFENFWKEVNLCSKLR